TIHSVGSNPSPVPDMPFGLRTSPFIFDLFAKGLHWMLIAILAWDIILHYLDDFLAVLPPGGDAMTFSTQFDNLCGRLGLKVNQKKDRMGTKAEFLGIEIDTEVMMAKLCHGAESE
ncbi:MAG: hypothetical protein Q9228_007165, partial [Teloschistes exilis]